jgi:uncharacterized protein DUF397
MTNQPPILDADTDLEVAGDRLASSGSAVPELPDPDDDAWRPGSRQSGLDDRVEFADLGERVAVRDAARPGGPGLLFHRSDWEHLCSLGGRAEIDLRDPSVSRELSPAARPAPPAS